MKRAIIDLGTNTFNLLIGEMDNGHLNRLRTEKEAVLLGMNGINHGTIAEAAWLRGIQTLIRFKAYCIEEGVSDSEIIGYGTSALRDAKNGGMFIQEVKEQTGIQIEIISGATESKLIYQGVRLLHDFQKPGMIMDIGGGSTEFILADRSGVQTASSFDIGVSRLYQEMGKNNNLTAQNYKFLEGYFDARLSGFFDANRSETLIGASGSFETFYEMIYQKRFSSHNSIERLPMNALMEKIDWVIDSRYEDRMNNEWIIPMRKQMLPIAAFKIKWVIERMNATKVLVCPYSLKEGAFLE
ncbi:MAG: exopolyphosphatase/guanosine-5'-triphosphate,3'-diphosphate pyrophosphatase [Crocinitomicaceae bacterium]|jgi:exopolyphosphatase/guanosine-5'-triphosphate,3'-diphosphate pyrophosphatase